KDAAELFNAFLTEWYLISQQITGSGVSNDVPLMHYLVYGLGRKHTRTKCYRNGTDIELLLCLPTTQELIIGWTKVCLCRTGNEQAGQSRSPPDSPLEGNGFEISVPRQIGSGLAESAEQSSPS